jgi:hypothetical protein
MFRITEQENKEIRKMYGLISEASVDDCSKNVEEFKEFRLWCSAKESCKEYNILPKESGKSVCEDTELLRAYNDKKKYESFKSWQSIEPGF